MQKSPAAFSTHWARIGLTLCAFIGLSGCGSAKFYPVKGKVIVYETGKYLTEGEVCFQPVSNSSLVATGTIKPNGTFSLETPGHGEGVLEGACRGAVVVQRRNGQLPVAERYQDFDTSELRYTVTARSENYFIIEVRRGGK